MSGHRRKKHGHEEHHVDERWLVSYADMITVLMALFIVLYAMSTVDQHKFDELKNSLATGFGVTKTEKLDENKSIVRKEDVVKDGAGFSNSTIALMQVAKEITDELRVAGVAGKAEVKAGSNTVTVSLVGSSTYFDGNSADLRHEARRVLKAITPTLRKHAGTVTVEGHADPHGSAGAFGSDWALASARATSVTEYLVDHRAVPSKQVSAVSFGSEHAKRGVTARAIEHNRRVDIVLHTVTIGTVPSPSTGEKTGGKQESGGHGAAEPTAEHGAETAAAEHD